MENKDMFIMYDDRLGQRSRKIFVQTALEDSISSHGTELVIPEYSCFSTRNVQLNFDWIRFQIMIQLTIKLWHKMPGFESFPVMQPCDNVQD